MNFRHHIKAVIAASFAAGSALALAADANEITKAAEFIAKSAKKLDVGKAMREWSDNPQVVEVRSYGDMKRAAAIYYIIDQLTKNDEKLFSPISATSTPSQNSVTIISRLTSYRNLKTLIGNSIPDVIIGDYLDGEIADLTLTLSGKIPLGIYLPSRKIRDEKRQGLLFVDKDFLLELLTFQTGPALTINSLASLTTVISLTQTCSRAAEVCANLQNK